MSNQENNTIQPASGFSQIIGKAGENEGGQFGRAYSASTGVNTLAVIEQLPKEIGQFTIASKVRPSAVYADRTLFPNKPTRNRFLDYVNSVCEVYDPSWPEREWNKTTTPEDIMDAGYEVIAKAVKHIPNAELQFNTDKYRWRGPKYSRPEFYLKIHYPDLTSQGAWPSMYFLAEMLKLDQEMAEIIMTVIGKAANKFRVATWEDRYNNMSDWLGERAEDSEFTEPEDKELATDFYKTEQGIMALKLNKLAKMSDKKLRARIRKYQWNTLFKKKILVWLRIYERMSKCDASIVDYCESNRDGGVDPWHQFGFHWDQDDIIGQNFNELVDASYNEGGCTGFTRVITITPSTTIPDQDPFPKLFENWMLHACFLFDASTIKNFKRKNKNLAPRKVRKSKKSLLINILK